MPVVQNNKTAYNGSSNSAGISTSNIVVAIVIIRLVMNSGRGQNVIASL